MVNSDRIALNKNCIVLYCCIVDNQNGEFMSKL